MVSSHVIIEVHVQLSRVQSGKVAGVAERIKVLRAMNAVEAAPERTAKRKMEGEEPVTSRIRRKAEAVETSVDEADDGWKGRVGERTGWRRG